jgi:hypothetical protein
MVGKIFTQDFLTTLEFHVCIDMSSTEIMI